MRLSDASEEWSDEFVLSWNQIRDVLDTVAVMPSDPSDLEKAQIANGTGGDVIRARLETVRRVFVSGGDRGKRLRIAARFLQKACGSDQDGDAHLFLATCLEGLLIDKSQDGDTARRLSDAAGFLLGRSQPEREELRNEAAYLYKVRSRYVHEGNYQGSEKGRRESLRLAGRVLAHEMRILE